MSLHRFLAEFEVLYITREANGFTGCGRAEKALSHIVGKRLTYAVLTLSKSKGDPFIAMRQKRGR